MARWLAIAVLVTVVRARNFNTPRLKTGTALDAADKALDLLIGLINLLDPYKPYYCDYDIEIHEVRTKDHYINTVFRLPRNESGAAAGQPVILQHGLRANADIWFQLKENSLPCMLARAGYDVWVHNARGNNYSKKYDYDRDPLGFLYWDFSFHAMAVYDLPAAINHILNATKRNDVVYIGHDMGATMDFVLLSEHPKYNQNISVAVSLAPLVYIKKHGKFWNFVLETVLMVATTMPIPPKEVAQLSPRNKVELRGPIVLTIWKIVKMALKVLDFTLKKTGHPGGLLRCFGFDVCSLKTLAHLFQMAVIGKFRQFHYGVLNPLIYHQWLPPEYKLRNIKTPHFIMYGNGDWIISTENVERFCEELPKKWRKCRKVNREGFDHSDFLLSKNAKQYVYDVIMRELARHLPQKLVSTECLSMR